MPLKPGECYYLQDELRTEIQKNNGKIYNDIEDVLNEYKNEKIVSIGDYVTYSFINKNFKPYLSIFDLKTKRKFKFDDLLEFFKHRLIVFNPPGCITYYLIDAINYATKNNIDAIQVVGEEDLATLISILLFDNSIIIIYGIPDIGMSIIEINEEWKNKAKSVIERMVIKNGIDYR
ncbi:MAG: DUF359 domain-containing protein [Thermoplasmata archaeon]|jgi:uncharacterized protein (UPF0218 family)